MSNECAGARRGRNIPFVNNAAGNHAWSIDDDADASQSRKAAPKAARPAKGAARPAAGTDHKAPTRPRRTPAETVELADRMKAARPDATDDDLAAELGITTARLRAVRRGAA